MEKSITSAPLVDAIARHAANPGFPFHFPGHGAGRAVDSDLRDLLGESLFKADLTELDGLDTLHSPHGPIAEAQRLAAVAYGAEASYFLVNGSTVGIHALILATCGPDRALVLPRDAHQSAMGGLILSGAMPAFVAVEWDEDQGLAGGMSAELLRQVLDATPLTGAVLVQRPTYSGVCPDLGPIVTACRERRLPLIVDEAHGAHLGSHPMLPASALAQGADAVVQSTHKLGGALTQGAMIHLNGERVDRRRVERALGILQTTSPSYPIMASLDAARRDRVLHGLEGWDRALALRGKVEAESPVPMLTASGRSGFEAIDPAKLAFEVGHCGYNGDEALELLANYGVHLELATSRHAVGILTPATTRSMIEQLLEALGHLAAAPRPSMPPIIRPPAAERVMSPREAFYAPVEVVVVEDAVGRISAEGLSPYPPGTPAILPGERVSEELVYYFKQVEARVVGASDPTLATLVVVRG